MAYPGVLLVVRSSTRSASTESSHVSTVYPCIESGWSTVYALLSVNWRGSDMCVCVSSSRFTYGTTLLRDNSGESGPFNAYHERMHSRGGRPAASNSSLSVVLTVERPTGLTGDCVGYWGVSAPRGV